jgi:uncharacterized repeat protein (TIGR03803 family)
MAKPEQPSTLHLPFSGSVLALLCALAMVATQAAQAQTYNVIYNFSGCADGYSSTSTLLMDGAGSLYGTTQYGGSACGTQGNGVVFRLKLTGAGWVETPIHTFNGQNDGISPFMSGGLTLGRDGGFYGTTPFGGHFGGGTVFRVRPPFRACTTALCPWVEDILYSFAGDGGLNPMGNVIFDSAGNIYGTTENGGSNFGTVFQLTRSGSGWTESLIGDVGGVIFAGVTLDRDGNVYGVNFEGGLGLGQVFQLTRSGMGWTENVLHTFAQGEGGGSIAGLFMDAAGNLYGATLYGSPEGGGIVYELSPSGGGWTYHMLHDFGRAFGPESTLTMDADGNLYGTSNATGAGFGSVFKLMRNGDSWTYIDLHDFGTGNDGQTPVGGVTLGSDGKLYGTTSAGGTHGAGVVWEITL